MKPNNVVIVINSFGGGGAERAMSLLAEKLALRGFDISLLAINKGYQKPTDSNLRVLEVGRNYKGSIVNLFKAIYRFQKIIWEIHPKIMVANCELPELFVALTLGRHNVIVVEHSLSTWKNHKVLSIAVNFLLNRRTKLVVHVSEQIQHRRILFAPRAIIRNPIDPNLTPDTLMGGIPPRFVFLGRLSAEKNPHEFLEIISEFSAHPAVLIGDGSLTEELRSKDTRANFLGYKTNPWAHISRSDLVIFTSLEEGDGIATLEAISLGVPLLMKDLQHYRKFNLPNHHYYSSVLDARRKIVAHLAGTVSLRPNTSKINTIRGERNLDFITDTWVKELNSLIS